MNKNFLVLMLSAVFLISACGKNEGTPSPNNSPRVGPVGPVAPGVQPNDNGQCQCDECGCYILYNDNTYTEVNSCNSAPQQNNYPQQNYYPQQNNYPQQRSNYPQQNYYPQQNNYPQQRSNYPQQNYYPQQNNYPQQNYGPQRRY